jgi:hypothetical protein
MKMRFFSFPESYTKAWPIARLNVLGLQNPWGSKLWGMTLGEQLFSTLGDKISVLIID